jgi:hypothetical protein
MFPCVSGTNALVTSITRARRLLPTHVTFRGTTRLMEWRLLHGCRWLLLAHSFSLQKLCRELFTLILWKSDRDRGAVVLKLLRLFGSTHHILSKIWTTETAYS